MTPAQDATALADELKTLRRFTHDGADSNRARQAIDKIETALRATSQTPDAVLEAAADAVDAARYAHPGHPRERPRSFAEADRSDREYAVRLARAALSTPSASLQPPDAVRMENAIRDSIEALERNSTSAPVVECLKAALTPAASGDYILDNGRSNG